MKRHEDLNSIIKTALDELNAMVNFSSGLARPRDEELKKTYMRALHMHCPVLDREKITNYMMNHHHWDREHTDHIIAMLDKLELGGKLVGCEATNEQLAEIYFSWKEHSEAVAMMEKVHGRKEDNSGAKK